MNRRNSSQPVDQPATSGVVWLAASVAALMIAQQIASKAIRDGFFLEEFTVAALPTAVLAAAVVSLASAFWFGRFISNVSPSVAVPLLFAAHGVLFLAESVLTDFLPRVVAASLFLHIAAFGGAVVSGFWSVINEHFDPYTARRVMGKIAGGATFGGLLGGGMTWLLSALQVPVLLGGLAVANWTCGLGLVAMLRSPRSKSNSKTKTNAHAHDRIGASQRQLSKNTSLFDGVEVLRNQPYPRRIGILVLLGATTTVLIDLVFKAEVKAHSASLVGFFAMFYTATGIITFLLQATASQRILRRFGVVPTITAFPAIALLGLVAAISLPSLIVFALLRGGMMVVENSLYRSGYELLYTAVPPEQKRSAKILIDLGCDRLGTATGSVIAMIIVAIVALSSGGTLLLGTASVTTLGCLALLIKLRRDYIDSLALRIRDSDDSPSPKSSLLPDSQALAHTFIDGHLSYGWKGISPSLPVLTSTESGQHITHQELVAAVRQRSTEKAGLHKAQQPLPSPMPSLLTLSSFVDTPLARLLRAPKIDEQRWRALSRSAPSMVGQLSDALLSARESELTRIRAAELLSTVPTTRTVSALMEALTCPEFRIRRAAAIALHRLCNGRPGLRPPERLLSALAAQELRRPARPQADNSPHELSSPFREDARGRRLAPSLELGFLLLAIGGNGPALLLAVSAITSGDATKRGTGLEYLDNLLPSDVRSRILGLVEHPELTQATRIWQTKAVADLASRLRSKEISIAELRMEYRGLLREEYAREPTETTSSEPVA